MDFDVNQKCALHERHDCPDALIRVSKNGFGLWIHDGGTSSIDISFCPWCGAKLSKHPKLPG
jgi:hypothetical protein